MQMLLNGVSKGYSLIPSSDLPRQHDSSFFHAFDCHLLFVDPLRGIESICRSLREMKNERDRLRQQWVAAHGLKGTQVIECVFRESE